MSLLDRRSILKSIMNVVLSHGAFGPEECVALEAAARSIGCDWVRAQDVADVSRRLDELVPVAVVALGVGAEASRVSSLVRSHAQCSAVAVISVADDVTSSSFTAAMSWGADDVIARGADLPGLAVRLAAAARSYGRGFAPKRGTAVLVEPVAPRRLALGRALAGAGFGVRDVEGAEAELLAVDLHVPLFVLAGNRVDALSFVARARQAGSMAKIVLTADGQSYEQLCEALADQADVAVLRGTAPADHVVFLANELSRPDLLNQRAAPRALFSTLVRFWPESAGAAAGDQPGGGADAGLSYNVSAHGLYVRTMAPPAPSRVMLALDAPRNGQGLALSGEVAWRRPFGADGQATAPPGFGVKLLGSAEDLARWRDSLGSLGG